MHTYVYEKWYNKMVRMIYLRITATVPKQALILPSNKLTEWLLTFGYLCSQHGEDQSSDSQERHWTQGNVRKYEEKNPPQRVFFLSQFLSYKTKERWDLRMSLSTELAAEPKMGSLYGATTHTSNYRQKLGSPLQFIKTQMHRDYNPSMSFLSERTK